MRDALKVAIGFGSIWGCFSLGALFFGAFTIGSNDSAPEVIALVLYGLTMLPASLAAIWYPRRAGRWLLFVSGVSVFGFIYQVVTHPGVSRLGDAVKLMAMALLVAVIPGCFGYLFLRLSPARIPPS